MTYVPSSTTRNWRDVGTFAVSMMVIGGFFAYIGLGYFYGPPKMEATQAAYLQGVLATAFASVVGFWVGSSIGSSAKNDWKKPE